ncbi:MAG: TRAM domain-containing protein, partial [Magnetococcales bacterium]|nr:TRAM domain-containing protein [Magnetococcales bacterium]
MSVSEVELTIQRLVAGGDGLGFQAGSAVFVPYAAPGERLRVRLTHVGRHYQRGEVIAVLDPGPDRIDPLCPLYGRCGGCQLQHINPQARQQAKHGFVLEALQRLGRVTNAAELTGALRPSPCETGYRHRASFKVRCIQGNTLLGFFAPGS